MKSIKLIKIVKRAGGVLIKKKGSHKTFRLPNGETVCIPYSGSHLETSKVVLSGTKKALKRNGYNGKDLP